MIHHVLRIADRFRHQLRTIQRCIDNSTAIIKLTAFKLNRIVKFGIRFTHKKVGQHKPKKKYQSYNKKKMDGENFLLLRTA